MLLLFEEERGCFSSQKSSTLKKKKKLTAKGKRSLNWGKKDEYLYHVSEMKGEKKILQL